MITIRKSVKPEYSDKIPEYISRAVGFLQNIYPSVNFQNTDFIFSAGYNRSRYFRNEVPNGKYLAPCTCIRIGATLRLYNKPSLGMKKTSLFVGVDTQVICALIHELTHHAQYEQNIRKGNELDTTANELKYLKEFHPNYYKKITK